MGRGKQFLFALVLHGFFSSLAFAAPAEVLILRHAEKPADDSIPHLSKDGYARAAALPELFDHDPRFTGPIDAIYASTPKREGKSVRAEETITPLAYDRGLRVRDANAYANEDDENDKGMEGLADHLLSSHEFDGKRIVVCLVHDEIPDFAQALGADDAPDKWNKGSFDRIWDIHFDENRVKFADLPQRLMPGDDDR